MIEDRPIPPYPAHLTKDERQAVFSVTVDGQIAIFTAGAEVFTDSDSIEVLQYAVAVGMVQHAWHNDRIVALEKRLADIEAGAARKAASPSGKKLDALAARVAELEAGGLIYSGIFQNSRATYRKGTVVTHGGSAWIALRETQEGEEPGSSKAWQLAVKRGKDGKDLRK